MGAILDDDQAMPGRNGIEPVHVDRQSGKVHRDDRFCAGGDQSFQKGEIHVVADGIDIAEYRGGAGEHDGAGG